jgi:hypothetical protein
MWVNMCLDVVACCRTSRQRQSSVRVLGLQRPLFVLLLAAGALYCWYRSRAWLGLALALLAGEAQGDAAAATAAVAAAAAPAATGNAKLSCMHQQASNDGTMCGACSRKSSSTHGQPPPPQQQQLQCTAAVHAPASKQEEGQPCSACSRKRSSRTHDQQQQQPHSAALLSVTLLQ